MIRRPYQDGYLLITQSAHAWLAGQLAQHWVARPEPYQSVIIATTLHDIGWLDKDAVPMLNTNQQALHFLEPELDDVEAMYERCVTHVMQIDPYAAILVNRHIQTIYRSRATHKRDPIKRLQPLLENLIEREQSTIKDLINHPVYGDYVDDVTLNHNYHILRCCDLLSLFVCGAFPADTVSDVPFQLGEFGQIHCEMLDEHSLRVSPNIFNQAEISIPLQAKFIPKQAFASQVEYSIAFHDAQFVSLSKTIIGS